MDSLAGHFLVMVGEACEHARTGRLPVDITLRDGRHIQGVPAPRTVEPGNPTEVDDTGYAQEFVVGRDVVHLDEIVEVRLLRPGS